MGDAVRASAAASADDDDESSSKTVFVTVGTTEFDGLIRRLCEESVLSLMRSKGYRKIVFQIGKGAYEPTLSTEEDGEGRDGWELSGVEISWFRLKPSIAEVRRAEGCFAAKR